MTLGKRFGFALIGLLLLGAGLGQAAPAGRTDTEELRLELREFLLQMRRLPADVRADVYEGEVALEQAITDVDQLDQRELRALERVLQRVPQWRRTPAVMAASIAGELPPTRRPPTALIEPAAFRSRWITALDGVAESALAAGGPKLAESASGLATRLAMADDEELALLELALVEQLPRWHRSLLGGEPDARTGPALAKSASCGSMSFPDDVLCWITEVVNEVAALPGVVLTEMETFIEDLFGDLASALADAGISLPQDESEWAGAAAQLVGVMSSELGVDFDDADWYLDLLNLMPSGLLNPPCPDVGTDLGIFDGEVGSVRGAYECKRGLDWVASALYENAPDDVWSIPVKTILAYIYYPVNSLCLCMEAQWQVEYDRLQGVHRDEFDVEVATFTQDRFADDPVDPTDVDVRISNRATQVSLDESRSRVAALDSSIVVVTSKADALQGELDLLGDGDAEQLDLIRSLADRELQFRIEKNLTDDHPDTISLFQMPESVGGKLEAVELVVTATIDAAAARGESVARAVQRRDRALQHHLEGEYKLAYDELRAAYRAVLR